MHLNSPTNPLYSTRIQLSSPLPTYITLYKHEHTSHYTKTYSIYVQGPSWECQAPTGYLITGHHSHAFLK